MCYPSQLWYKYSYLMQHPKVAYNDSYCILHFKPISDRVGRASATEAVDLGSIPGRVKPKTIKIGIHSFPA